MPVVLRVYLTKEEEEVPTYDLAKHYRYVTGKSILCYVAYVAWDCHSLHEASSAFQSIAIRTRSSRLTFTRTRELELQKSPVTYVRHVSAEETLTCRGISAISRHWTD